MVIVNDTKNCVFTDLFANFDPVADCAQVIANVQIAGWLNAEKTRFTARVYRRSWDALSAWA